MTRHFNQTAFRHPTSAVFSLGELFLISFPPSYSSAEAHEINAIHDDAGSILSAGSILISGGTADAQWRYQELWSERP